MYYKNFQEWFDEKAIRVVRQGQRNYFVAADIAAGINESALLPGQYRLRVSDFERLPLNGIATICLTATGLQRLYASLDGVVDIDGGMPLAELNSTAIVNTQLDQVPLPETEQACDSPIQKALMPYLASLISPNHAVYVTPVLARILLGGNLKNRPKNNRNFKKLCSQLRSGKWKVNGATITLSRHWQILDGQHRLFAIVETGITAPCILGFGFDPAVFATLDQGAKRTNADNLSIAGFAGTRLLAAVIGVYQAVKGGNTVSNSTRLIEPEECIRLAFETPNFQAAIKKAKEYHRMGAQFVPLSLIGGLMARGMEINKRAAAKFFDYLLNDNCKGVRPVSIQKLRTQLLRDYMSKSKGTDTTYLAAMIIKVWNAYRQGQSIPTVKFVAEHTENGATVGEPYPVMA